MNLGADRPFIFLLVHKTLHFFTPQPKNSISSAYIFFLTLECQGGGGISLQHQEQQQDQNHRIKGYSTQKNDIWSLGIILINLTAGRNPWKQATLRNKSFASYVRNPRHFFRSILPCISEELERILLRIFCLNPARLYHYQNYAIIFLNVSHS
jgi:serine/threonine protein kinase